MLGLSPNVRRSELLHAKHTGNPKEFSDWVREHVLDHGHAVEALARPIVENIVVGDDLYPVTRSLGRISASCDGLTIDETIAFEHKQWNADLAEQVRAGIQAAGYLKSVANIDKSIAGIQEKKAKVVEEITDRIKLAHRVANAAAERQTAKQRADALAKRLNEQLGSQLVGSYWHRDAWDSKRSAERVAPEGCVFLRLETMSVNEEQARIMLEALAQVRKLQAERKPT